MIDTASILAKRLNAPAVLTGDSLGQVSSQTLSNITALDNFSNISIFRPLIGFNKIETINIAKKIGTYDTSIIPHDDACSMLAPKHPVITCDRKYMEEFFNNHDFESDLYSMIERSEVLEFNPGSDKI